MILFGKRLMMDTDPKELARVKQILDQNGMEYHVKTTVSDNVMSRSFNAKAAEHIRTSYSAMQTQTYLYQLFVKRRDYARAKKLSYGK